MNLKTPRREVFVSLRNLRAKVGARLNSNSEAGFTLVELLVVMLILGVLAAIALPAFFNQKQKANDAKAKETAHSAQVAMETCSTEHSGSYATCEEKALKAIEPTLNSGPTFTTPVHEEKAYTIVVTAEVSNDKFEIKRLESGAVEYPCSPKATGGCPSTLSWKNG